MKNLSLFVTSLALAAGPALAQQGAQGWQPQLSALQAQNASLQQQVTALQSSVGNLQAQINGLANSLQGSVANLQTQINGLGGSTTDDGTAGALVGTWNGTVTSIEFDRSTKFVSGTTQSAPFFSIFGGVPPALAPTFMVPLLGPCSQVGGGAGTCQTGGMMVGVNPDYWLAKSENPQPIAFTLSRDGMKLAGAVTQNGQEIATLSGIALGNNFFLLKARAPATGPCAGNGFVVYQGTGSLSPDRTRLSFTGSAIEADCRHSVFRVALGK